MLLPFRELVQRYKLQLQTIWHVGAYQGEERFTYSTLEPKPRRVFWIEGDEGSCYAIRQRIASEGPAFETEQVFRAYLWSKAGERRRLYRASNGQSSSILEPLEHLKEHPDVLFEFDTLVETDVLEYYITKCTFGYGNVLVMDVQGAELMVLEGADYYVPHFDAIYLEVNYKEMYYKCSMLFELDNFLSAKGFLRMDTQMTPHGWGDALYVNQRILNG